jgi:hypothetical protein
MTNNLPNELIREILLHVLNVPDEMLRVLPRSGVLLTSQLPLTLPYAKNG